MLARLLLNNFSRAHFVLLVSDLKKTAQLGGRITQDLRDRMDTIYDKYGVTASQLMQDALEALCDFVEAEGKYDRRFRVVRAETLGLVAEEEDAGPEGGKPKSEAQRLIDEQRASRRRGVTPTPPASPQ